MLKDVSVLPVYHKSVSPGFPGEELATWTSQCKTFQCDSHSKLPAWQQAVTLPSGQGPVEKHKMELIISLQGKSTAVTAAGELPQRSTS